MSTKRKCLINPSTSTSTIVPVSNQLVSIPPSELPQEIIISILKRLPVKSILRFKCVSKDWLSLLSSPNFVSIHLQETLKTPLRDSFIISCNDQRSLLNLNSIEREPLSLVNLSPEIFRKMDLVGSINGLLCLSSSPLGQTVVLWNPAMNLHKAIRLPIHDENTHSCSLGFAYDSINDDYNIIRIDCLDYWKFERAEPRYHAEVYSASLDYWKRVPIDCRFCEGVPRNNLIVNGIPYWFYSIYQPDNQGTLGLTPMSMYYDVQDGSFKHQLPPKMGIGQAKTYVDWKGNLGMIVFSPSKDEADIVDIWVYDEMRMCYDKISSHGPLTNGIKEFRPMQCSKDGVILAVALEGKLILYDPVSNGIKEVCCFPRALGYFTEAFTYTESLVTVKGMEQVKEQDKDGS